MRKLAITVVCTTLAFSWVLSVSPDKAAATLPFKKEFFEVYVVEEPSTPQEAAFAEAANAKSGKCWICHVDMSAQGETGLGKNVSNNYGKALSQLLDPDDYSSERRINEPAAVKAELRAAMQQVEATKSDPSDPSSPTFGELMAAGKLPGNDIPDPEDLKKAIAERDQD